MWWHVSLYICTYFHVQAYINKKSCPEGNLTGGAPKHCSKACELKLRDSDLWFLLLCISHRIKESALLHVPAKLFAWAQAHTSKASRGPSLPQLWAKDGCSVLATAPPVCRRAGQPTNALLNTNYLSGRGLTTVGNGLKLGFAVSEMKTITDKAGVAWLWVKHGGK